MKKQLRPFGPPPWPPQVAIPALELRAGMSFHALQKCYDVLGAPPVARAASSVLTWRVSDELDAERCRFSAMLERYSGLTADEFFHICADMGLSPEGIVALCVLTYGIPLSAKHAERLLARYALKG